MHRRKDAEATRTPALQHRGIFVVVARAPKRPRRSHSAQQRNELPSPHGHSLHARITHLTISRVVHHSILAHPTSAAGRVTRKRRLLTTPDFIDDFAFCAGYPPYNPPPGAGLSAERRS